MTPKELRTQKSRMVRLSSEMKVFSSLQLEQVGDLLSSRDIRAKSSGEREN